MADLLTSALAATGTLVTAIGGPLLTSGIQNRREARLRRSIAANVELANQLRKEPETVRSMVPALEHLISDQVESLVRREVKDLRKQRDWASLGVVIFLVAILGWIPIWMWSLHRWWATVIAVAVSAVLILFVIVGVQMTFWPKKKDGAQHTDGPGTPETS